VLRDAIGRDWQCSTVQARNGKLADLSDPIEQDAKIEFPAGTRATSSARRVR
jgi:hypothetical protein